MTRQLACTFLAALALAGCRSNGDPIDDLVATTRCGWSAETAWRNRRYFFDGLPNQSSLKGGFKAGYRFAASGYTNCEPPAAPRRYWRADGHSVAAQYASAVWSEGFSYGALAAQEDGATGFNVFDADLHLPPEGVPEVIYYDSSGGPYQPTPTPAAQHTPTPATRYEEKSTPREPVPQPASESAIKAPVPAPNEDPKPGDAPAAPTSTGPQESLKAPTLDLVPDPTDDAPPKQPSPKSPGVEPKTPEAVPAPTDDAPKTSAHEAAPVGISPIRWKVSPRPLPMSPIGSLRTSAKASATPQADLTSHDAKPIRPTTEHTSTISTPAPPPTEPLSDWQLPIVHDE